MTHLLPVIPREEWMSAAACLAWRLAQRYPECADLTELHQLQIAWKAEQAASLADYFRRQGKPADDVSSDWPLVPHQGVPACL